MKARDRGADSAKRPAAAEAVLRGATQRLSDQSVDINESPRMLAQRQALEGINGNGMPNPLKAGIESLSGMDLSDVQVHRNSSQPAQLGALAYAQGNDIHLGPGQEQHLPHEAWHVVQQRQGRVHETTQVAGAAINDDAGLEHEADRMGHQAASHAGPASSLRAADSAAPVQPKGTVRQFLGERWYEHPGEDPGEDGEHLKGRWIGLPSLSWMQLKADHPKYPDYKVYISIDNFRKWDDPDKLSKVVDPTGLFDAMQEKLDPVVSTLKTDVMPLVDDLRRRYDEIGPKPTRENIAALTAQVVTFEQALGAALKNTWTPVKLVLGVLGFGLLAGGGMLLGLLSLPVWAVILVEGLSFIYGLYLLYRWSQSDLLPTAVKTGLLLLNGLAMTTLVASTLYDVAGYYAHLLATAPFHHIHFAAVPFGLVIEFCLVKMIEKLEAMREAASNPPSGEDQGERDGGRVIVSIDSD